MESNYKKYKSFLRSRRNSGNMSRTAVFMLLVFFISAISFNASAQSVRAERKLINEGNKFYREGKYPESILKYKAALEVNPSSDVARFNLGLGRVRMAEKSASNDSVSKKLMAEAVQDLSKVAQLDRQKPDLSSKANYNLGNLSFQQEDYDSAIKLYKQALRLNPGFNDARRNLRIAQLRRQNQQDNKDEQQDNKDNQQDQQNQDNQNQQQNQNQDQNQDQQQNKQDQNQEQQPPRENELSKQAANQILNAVENNEAATRARKGNNEKGEKAYGAGSNVRKW